jgi:hypothetical protein
VGHARPRQNLAGFGAVDPWICRHRTAPIVDNTTRHAGTASTISAEAGLTVPMTAPPPDHGVANSNGAEKPATPTYRTPVLAHRMKHDKSILALVVSSQYIWAGTQGGEILVQTIQSTLCILELIRTGLQPRHVRPPKSHPSA